MRLEDKTFVDQILPLDGNEFHNCTFRGCVLEFAGAAGFVLSGCTFESPPRFSVTGAASITFRMLARMYGTGFDEIVESLFENIRQSSMQGVPPEAHND